MNWNCITFFSVASILLWGTAGQVGARGLGSCLPMLGDIQTAFQYAHLGDIASQEGNWAEARKDYQHSLASSPFNEYATLGLARCDAAAGDFQKSLPEYRDVIGRNDYDIDYLTEYILVLQEAGQIPEAISNYNHVMSLCKRGYSATRLEVYPSDFRPDGSDYNPNEMAAMTHLMRALNSSNDDEKRKSAEMGKARTFAPQSSIVYFYEGILLQQAKKTGATQAFKQALALDHGANAKVIAKHIKLSQG